MQDRRTEFGRDVDLFCAKHNVKKVDLAVVGGTSIQFFSNCCYGRYAKNGSALKEKIYAFMERYEAEREGESR